MSARYAGQCIGGPKDGDAFESAYPEVEMPDGTVHGVSHVTDDGEAIPDYGLARYEWDEERAAWIYKGDPCHPS